MVIIQLGGFVCDEDFIKKVDEYGIVMVFIGIRYFKY